MLWATILKSTNHVGLNETLQCDKVKRIVARGNHVVAMQFDLLSVFWHFVVRYVGQCYHAFV
jgi:hypothetical protein